MIDICLKAENDLELILACPFLKRDGEWVTSADDFSLDLIGPIVTRQAEFDEEGNETTPPQIDNGFHANLRCTEEIAGTIPERVIIHPKNPYRVWA